MNLEETPHADLSAADDPAAREVRLLADFQQAAAERDAEETQIEAQYQASIKAAERGFHETKESLTTWLSTARRDVAHDFSQQEQHAHTRFQLETASVNRKFTAFQQHLAKEFEVRRQRAERRLKEVRWEAETVFDAQKHLPPRQLEEFEEKLDGWLSRLRAEHQEARRLLELWRQTASDRSADPLPPPIEAGETISQLQERINFVAAQRVTLALLRVPPLAAGSTLVWAFLGLAALLAAAAIGLGLGPYGAVAAALLSAAAGTAATIYLRKLGKAQIDRVFPQLDQASREAESLAARARADAEARATSQLAMLIQRRDDTLLAAEQKYQDRTSRVTDKHDSRLQEATARYPQRLQEIAAQREVDLQQALLLRTQREAEVARKESELAQLDQRHRRQVDEISERRAAHWNDLAQGWQASLACLQSSIEATHNHQPGTPGRGWLADWNPLAAGGWPPAETVPCAVRFGEFRVNLSQIPHAVSSNPRLAQLTPASFTLPALAPFPARSSLLFKARAAGRGAAIESMQAVLLRLLVSIPPGKVRFTFIDPVGLGENFAAFMHLADYNEALISSRIWTESRHIEQRLTDLSEHMENVIQKYLRNEFQSIEQYNQYAGEIAEPFRFLVIANYPANFSEAAQRRLLSIVSNGARCGVHTLFMLDGQVAPPSSVAIKDLEQHCTVLEWREGQFTWKHDQFGQFALSLDAPPPPALVTDILHTAGRYALDASRVEVPFEVIAPPSRELWTSSARSGIDVPLGRAGATRLQHMKLGQGTSQHVLVAGKTGSGKSTLLHALITNIALRYSPDEIELYLVDFKQGVEFKTYASHELPHARVVAIESDREFGLSVLARLDAEIKTRADRFRALGVQDLAGYRQADAATPLPRVLLVVDEFQEFFVEDDKISQEAALLLDRLVRQGRAFGIHVLLGSQTLAGTYTLARSTIGQMAVRIALQCSEADAHLILSEDNSAARLLSRAGEAIYNDSNGLIEGNHPFQIVWLNDSRREEYLEQVQALAKTRGLIARPQVVFEGNIPADPQRNEALGELLQGARPEVANARAWLGEAVAIKEPTSVTFRPQSGGNLLIVGQHEEAAIGMMTTALVSLAAQQPVSETNGAQFYFLDGSSAGSPAAAALAQWPALMPHPSRLVSWRELPAAVNELTLGVERRQKNAESTAKPIFVFLYGLQKLRDLRRQEDDFSFSRGGEGRPPDPAKQFCTVLRDGPTVSVYTIVWCDSMTNLNRAWDRQTLREFETRVALQMSGNDSSMFLDTPQAAKLGPHRALLHSEDQGLSEKFRPYRLPSEEWLAWVRGQLHNPPGQRDDCSRRLAV